MVIEVSMGRLATILEARLGMVGLRRYRMGTLSPYLRFSELMPKLLVRVVTCDPASSHLD